MKIYFAGGGISDKCNDNIKFDSRLLSFYFYTDDQWKSLFEFLFQKMTKRKHENISCDMAGRSQSGQSPDK